MEFYYDLEGKENIIYYKDLEPTDIFIFVSDYANLKNRDMGERIEYCFRTESDSHPHIVLNSGYVAANSKDVYQDDLVEVLEISAISYPIRLTKKWVEK